MDIPNQSNLCKVKIKKVKFLNLKRTKTFKHLMNIVFVNIVFRTSACASVIEGTIYITGYSFNQLT